MVALCNSYLLLHNKSPQTEQLERTHISSVQFSCSVVSDSLRPHESQHARPPCPSPTPRVHSDSRPSSQCCHPAISSSVIPFSSCPQIPPSIRVFFNESTLHMGWPKYWSFSFSIIPSKEIPGLNSHITRLKGQPQRYQTVSANLTASQNKDQKYLKKI